MSAGFISEADAAILVSARDVLKKIAAATADLHWQADPHTAYARGRSAVACEQAAQAIFDALNITSAYCHDEVASRAVTAMVRP